MLLLEYCVPYSKYPAESARLTRLRTELVAAERAAASLAAGDGGVSRKTTPPQAAMTAGEASRYKEVHCALEVLRWLPEEMVPADSLLVLLRHPAQGVREAALPLLRPSLCASPRLRDLVDAALALLHYAAAARRASKALRALCASPEADENSLIENSLWPRKHLRYRHRYRCRHRHQ